MTPSFHEWIQSAKLRRMIDFSFYGQRAGSEAHRDLVEGYAHVLQNQDCFVTVDGGAVESQFPGITVHTLSTLLHWSETTAAVEVELDAHKKSDEAILGNFRKHRGHPVRFVMMSEKDMGRVVSVIAAHDVTCSRVERFVPIFQGRDWYPRVMTESSSRRRKTGKSGSCRRGGRGL